MAVIRPPDEQRYRRNEQGVLAELDEGDNVVVEERVVLRHGPDRLEREPAEQEEPGIQTARPGRRPLETVPRGDDDRGSENEHDGGVRETEVDRRGADLDAVLRLEPLVEERNGIAAVKAIAPVDSRSTSWRTRADGGSELVSATAALYGGPGRPP